MGAMHFSNARQIVFHIFLFQVEHNFNINLINSEIRKYFISNI
jgi:hypothetical protein